MPGARIRRAARRLRRARGSGAAGPAARLDSPAPAGVTGGSRSPPAASPDSAAAGRAGRPAAPPRRRRSPSGRRRPAPGIARRAGGTGWAGRPSRATEYGRAPGAGGAGRAGASGPRNRAAPARPPRVRGHRRESAGSPTRQLARCVTVGTRPAAAGWGARGAARRHAGHQRQRSRRRHDADRLQAAAARHLRDRHHVVGSGTGVGAENPGAQGAGRQQRPETAAQRGAGAKDHLADAGPGLAEVCRDLLVAAALELAQRERAPLTFGKPWSAATRRPISSFCSTSRGGCGTPSYSRSSCSWSAALERSRSIAQLRAIR